MSLSRKRSRLARDPFLGIFLVGVNQILPIIERYAQEAYEPSQHCRSQNPCNKESILPQSYLPSRLGELNQSEITCG